MTLSCVQASIIHDDGISNTTTERESMPNHVSALKLATDFLKDHFAPSFTSQVHSVGHRIVHGLHMSSSTIIDDTVRETIMRASDLAPLHNPPNLQGVDAARAIFPHASHVAVFDTAFHQTMPPHAYMYALPYDLYENRAIRRYGFHGTSYRFLVDRAAAALHKPVSHLNAVLCHLGAGASMCAVQCGRSIDTTMGMTPLEGLMMGSRCGDVDPAIVTYLAERGKMGIREIDSMMNKKSGFLGLAGNVDLRSVMQGMNEGDSRCALAVDMFVHRIRKYMGAYLMHLDGDVDCIVFSAGIGENSAEIRKRVCSGMAWAGVEIDDTKNEAVVGLRKEGAMEIQSDESRIKVMVIPTDEEMSIAEQTLEVTSSRRSSSSLLDERAIKKLYFSAAQ